MMLWWKGWSESRVRFLWIAGALAALCAFAVVFEPYIREHVVPLPLRREEGPYTEYIYNMIFAGSGKGIFALMVIFLGLGGLQRERARNTAGFTLALPVSRLRAVGTQIGVGVLELAALVLIPAVLIPGLSIVMHRTYPVEIALHFSVLWFFGGLVIFAASFFLSVVAPGEYTAPVICYLALVVHTLVAAWHPLARYRLNLMWVMGEFQRMRWDAAHGLLYPPSISWVRMAVMAALSVALLLAAVGMTERQDF